ncbi:MAG TPA: methyltransferase domain-containing protein [Kofleriaceae bacterium]|nr:methyltransferase domain-containing protein [Kofleriaceae bacterium]
MEQAQRLPDFADIFERILVPAIFDRYARDLIERARPIGPSDRILDLGCGTGIVARNLRDRLGGATRITGLDINAQMIAKAKSLAPEIEWHEGNAVALPFADRSFDIVLSQQMLQFTPDRTAAVREIKRVLAPGGRVIASTWRPRTHQGFFEVLGTLGEQHLGPSNDKRWSLDADELRDLFTAAGFTDIRLDTASLPEHYSEFAPRMNVMAAGHDLEAFGPEDRARRMAGYEAESAAAMKQFAASGGGYDNRTVTNIVIARVA